MTQKKYLFVSGLIILLIFLFCSIVSATDTQLKFAQGGGGMGGAINIAIAKGYFRDQGIKAMVKKHRKGRIAFENYLSGKCDVGTANLGSLVLSDFDISKHRIVASLAYSDNLFKIIGKKSAGITKPQDLSGKKLAMPKKTAHFYLYKFLVHNGIDPKSVDIVFKSKKQLPEAIASGQVDAIFQHGMPVEKAKKLLKGDWVQFQDDSIHRKAVQVVMRKDWIDANPEKVKGILKALMRGEAFIHSNPDESIAFLAKAKNYSLEAMTRTVREETEYYLSLRQTLIASLESMEQWAIESSRVSRTTPRNYLDLIDWQPLEAIAPERVTLIK